MRLSSRSRAQETERKFNDSDRGPCVCNSWVHMLHKRTIDGQERKAQEDGEGVSDPCLP